jgi:2-methylcitrate dehydratase PrpD
MGDECRFEGLVEKITVSPDPGLTHDYLDLDKKSIGTGVTVHLKDQSVLPEILVEYPIGHAEANSRKTWRGCSPIQRRQSAVPICS